MSAGPKGKKIWNGKARALAIPKVGKTSVSRSKGWYSKELGAPFKKKKITPNLNEVEVWGAGGGQAFCCSQVWQSVSPSHNNNYFEISTTQVSRLNQYSSIYPYTS